MSATRPGRGLYAALATAVYLAVGSSAAQAERVVALPHGGDTRLTELRSAAHEAVLTALAEQGFEVRAAAGAGARAGSGAVRSEGCTQIGCAPALLAAARADLAVAVAVWQGESGPQVNITLVDTRGNRYPAVEPVGVAGTPAAARDALLAARGLQLLGPGPWVQVLGAPEGASVRIDGEFAGTLPYRAALSSGDHVLEVQADGHAPQRRDLQMPLDPTTTLRVEVVLEAAAAAPAHVAERGAVAPGEVAASGGAAAARPPALAPEPAPRDDASVWNYVLGGAVIAGGLAVATIDPLRAAARDGDCADRECTRLYAFGADSVLKIVAGTALIGAGVVVMAWQPIRVQARLEPGAAALAVHARF